MNNRINDLKSGKKIWIYLLMISFFFSFHSCTKFEVENTKQINIQSLTIENIDTKLDIIHLQLDTIQFDSMIEYPHLGVEAFAQFSYFIDKEAVISQRLIEMKNKGSSTLYYPLKSFKIKFDKKLKNNETPIFVPEKLLPNHNLDVLKKITLRNSGNDFAYTMIKDISFTQLAIDLNLDLELGYYKPVQVFVNNEYYGLLNMRIDKDDNSLGKMLQVDNDDINILKICYENDNEKIEIEGENKEVMQKLITAVQDEDLEYLLEKIDLNCFADYLVFEDFLGNWDWPQNNVEIYNVGPNGKFRFFMYDLDMAVNKDKFFALNSKEDKLINKMYFILMEDKNFNELLKQKRAYVYENATEDLFNNILDQNAQKIENELDYNIAKYNSPELKTAWYFNIQRLKEQYKLRTSNWAEHHQMK